MRMFVFVSAATGMLALGSAAFAAFSDVDTDGDGAITGAEMLAAFPDATAETMAAVDVNADGTISEEEYVAAVDAGILPAE